VSLLEHPYTSGFLRYFRACSWGPVSCQGAPGVPQGTWGVRRKRMVCPYWMLMEFPISPYHWVGLLAHIPNIVKVSKLDFRRGHVIEAELFSVGMLWRWNVIPVVYVRKNLTSPKKTRRYMYDVNFSADCCSEVR
jgi:hypothetical protein